MRAIAIILALLIGMGTAAALGISPGRVTLDFQPGMSTSITLKIVNNEHKDMSIALYPKGALKDYLKVEREKMNIKKSDNEVSVGYTISLPDKLPPGTQTGEIVAREINSGSSGGGMTVGANLAVASQVRVLVPYPGKYATIRLTEMYVEKEDKVVFFVEVNSLGKEGFNGRVTIVIFDSDNRKIAEVKTNSEMIEGETKKELYAEWKKTAGPGVYKAFAVMHYNGKTAKASSSFLLGKFFLVPLDIYVNNFKLGEIAKFNILVENIANSKVRDAVSRMLLKDMKGESVADIKSQPESFKAREKKEMTAYWDTSGVDKGLYLGKLILSYENKSATRDIKTRVEEDRIKTEIVGVTGEVVAGTGTGFREEYLYLIIGVLVMLNAGWWVYFSRRK